jgi:uncharacterized protein (TIGR00730 family)
MEPTNNLHSFDHIHGLEPQRDADVKDDLAYWVQQIKDTADKLVRDHANRGDVKLLTTALKELRYSFKVFAPYRHHRKVTVFGSARLPLSDPSCQQAIELGQRLADAGYMVITGAAAGIMEAGHVGAGRANSIGINILLPFEQAPNSVIAGDKKLMNLRYFFTRKLLFVKETDAIVLFPGGFGTLDEGFEVLTLVQTGKSHIFPIVFVDTPGGGYWDHVVRFFHDVLLERKLISPHDMSLFRIVNSAAAASSEILNFYRVYHSMRYVHGDLVLRLLRPLSEETLEHIRLEFKDIVKSGTFEQTGALTEESDDRQVAQLKRLVFKFDRHSLGRLRELIDVINQEGLNTTQAPG